MPGATLDHAVQCIQMGTTNDFFILPIRNIGITHSTCHAIPVQTIPVRMWLLHKARKLAIHRTSFGIYFLRFWFPKSVAWWGAPLQNFAMFRSLSAGVSGNGKKVINRDRNHGSFWWIFCHWHSGINRREPNPMAASAVRLNGKADDNNNNSQATKQRYHCCVIL